MSYTEIGSYISPTKATDSSYTEILNDTTGYLEIMQHKKRLDNKIYG